MAWSSPRDRGAGNRRRPDRDRRNLRGRLAVAIPVMAAQPPPSPPTQPIVGVQTSLSYLRREGATYGVWTSSWERGSVGRSIYSDAALRVEAYEWRT
jgi:hypothetical protein